MSDARKALQRKGLSGHRVFKGSDTLIVNDEKFRISGRSSNHLLSASSIIALVLSNVGLNPSKEKEANPGSLLRIISTWYCAFPLNLSTTMDSEENQTGGNTA